jgi:hypothetical protein
MSDLALSIVLGIALAAATGFRVFLPMLIVSGAAYTGHLHLDDSFAWLGTPSALMMLSVAALAEVLAYTIPVIDNLLDTVATPAAFVAGTIVSAAVMIDAPPMVKWTAAVIAGGGIAGLTQGLTGILRAHSTVLTGGLGNSVLATAELGGRLAGRHSQPDRSRRDQPRNDPHPPVRGCGWKRRREDSNASLDAAVTLSQARDHPGGR